MPGWYIHMEAAKKMADALRAGQVGPEFPGPLSKERAQELGEICHTWRNYLALGAIGPDMFYLLPDFHSPGGVLLNVVEWIRDVYEALDDQFLGAWNKYVDPVGKGAEDLANGVSGQVLDELRQTYDGLAEALKLAVVDLLAHQWDWFGLFTSGVPQGFADNAFFWSDMFHYRKTYEFAQRLWLNAETPQQKAFALGWMSHCATDVTGHSFVNAKCGGPYRDHWQRHHLIENHMDACAYDSQHGGIEPYGEYDTSALHFRIAFREGLQAPYRTKDKNGKDVPMHDAPAYDYFSGFPQYPLGGDLTSRTTRDALFDLDSNDFPEELAGLLIRTMHEIWDDGFLRPGSGEPKVLLDADPAFRDGDSGVPSVKAIQNTYWTVYKYLKFTASGGYRPPKPAPPPLVGDKRPPPFPGFSGVIDDPSRGGDQHDLNIVDVLLALLAWPAYLVELGIWAATVLPNIAVDIATYPVRETMYHLFVVPAYSAYLAARIPLVMGGFLVPKHGEIDRGLVELGVSHEHALADLRAALDSPDGKAPPTPPDEPSGRADAKSSSGADPEFPRDVVSDSGAVIANILGYPAGVRQLAQSCGRDLQPSEFLRPWAYPLKNQQGDAVAGEAARSHAGPWLQGENARSLLLPGAGHAATRSAFEKAAGPEQTDKCCETHLKKGEHLGNPVDYSLYVVGQITAAKDPDVPALPDFNLDADRGYGYRCWDWNRRVDSLAAHVNEGPVNGDKESSWHYQTFNVKFPAGPQGEPGDRFAFLQPCTPPQGCCIVDPDGKPGPLYVPGLPLCVHYLDGLAHDPGCTCKPVPPAGLASGPGTTTTVSGTAGTAVFPGSFETMPAPTQPAVQPAGSVSTTSPTISPTTPPVPHLPPSGSPGPLPPPPGTTP
jgi:hypothetical protein